MVWYLGGFSEARKITKPLAKYRIIAYTIGYVSYFIDIFLLKEYWLVMSLLFGFFGTGLSVGLAYAMF